LILLECLLKIGKDNIRVEYATGNVLNYFMAAPAGCKPVYCRNKTGYFGTNRIWSDL
jgi:hypothetical protein